MKPRVRDLVLEHAKALGIHLVEVITNDEHSETGIRPSITYIPVHESSEMLKAIQEKSLELLKTQPSAGAWLYVLRLNTKLMGEAAECLEELLGSSIREAAALLLSYVCLTPLVLQLVSIFTGFL
jgi:putative membrane protein